MAKRAAQGVGTIRKKTVTRNGRNYIYWEARVTVGRDPGTGKQIQKSFTGKTQKEVREKLQAAAVAVNTGTYIPPQKITVGEWLNTWVNEYLSGVKPSTASIYGHNIQRHIKPALGSVQLSDLRAHMVQKFINSLNLSPASVRLVYKVLHQALAKAVQLEYLSKNPASGCELPRVEQKEIHPLDDKQATALLEAVRGSQMESLISTALFTGLRLSELLGLTWNVIDFERNVITIDKQLAIPKHRVKTPFISPKNGKIRTITAAMSVMESLQAQRHRQDIWRQTAGPLWNNTYHLVFTIETGSPLDQWKVEKYFHDVLAVTGIQDVRFHDLRHTYAVNAIRAGDDIKTIQGNLGHATAAFTLDRYGHFTDRMRQDSAARMEGFIKNVLNL